jgi:hypothetical protein
MSYEDSMGYLVSIFMIVSDVVRLKLIIFIFDGGLVAISLIED